VEETYTVYEIQEISQKQILGLTHEGEGYAKANSQAKKAYFEQGCELRLQTRFSFSLVDLEVEKVL